MNVTVVVPIVLAACLVGAFAQAQRGDRYSGSNAVSRSEVIARSGMACTSQPLATMAAIDILKKGGSAVDAAIAANAVQALVEPTTCGIGGDLFAIVWDAKTKKLHGLNASGRSPHGLTLDELKKQLESLGVASIPKYGPLPITVPGCIDGWFELHAKFGRLPMSEVLAPAIRYAKEGFPVSELIAQYWENAGRILKDQPGFAKTYLPGGKAPAKGDVFRNPDFAATLEALSRGGRDAFYRGELTPKLAAFCERNGGYLRERDFNDHTSTWVDPVSTNYRGYEVWELPPSGQGIAVLQMLNMLEAADLKALGHNSAEYLHLLVETKKIVYEDRARYYADPDFFKAPLDMLLSKAYAARRRALFSPDTALTRIAPGEAALAEADSKLGDGDTIYLTVADKDRNMVSLIQSNYRGFGSGLCPDGMGFCLQDRGELFHLDPLHPNVYAPHKRPFHTIIPAFVTRDGKPFLSFGVMGGDMQPQGHVQILCNLIDFGMNLQEAGDAARFHHTRSSEPTGEIMSDGGTLNLESAIGDDVRQALAAKGHRIGNTKGGFGGYQAILYDASRDVYFGASEFRKDGMAAGY
ncbi:MAG: gamma-glutamyltransferase [Phycisphaerae bacterium]|nr:MAG: gamma-glutamyltransferase [Planctomycetota bacterium]KAB2950059.1 MAG: gamma-glutamyltransferase [Phycisphaerae bacterium]MBE7458291.1 gamma-glutamyltransferase [Planctomycetia bacterium]MCK6466325.1 gamma-glutamyltransferase [Phycisphaerae bacterium]MCL4719335.1 gamma-glutamyltransferase [Phycisphaerae bacterium]